ncbi:hypothetical protein MACH24_09220 [Erythrobacter sp. Dej080120_24]|uniref:hypothetical protein n=1 Tax=Erythrobacter sp. Dej080120_24 TaxID=3024837 RepID=UPI00291FD351|nr:hypothetical protein MACH24_09220 [Erythrobacter sp. Dej080120_24]
MIHRRFFIGTACAAATATAARPALGHAAGHRELAELDPLETMIRLRARSDGELSIAWLHAQRELVLDGEITPFCALYALVLTKFRKEEDAYVGKTVEITYYCDPKTEDLLTTTTIRGGSGPVEVPIYRAGPMDVRFKRSLDEWERHEPAAQGASSGDFAPASDVHLVRGVRDPYVLNGNFYLRADEYGRVYTDTTKPPVVFYREWLVWKAKAEDVLASDSPDVPSSFNYSAASGLRPWMKLEGKTGHTMENGVGGKVGSIGEVPPRLIALLSENDPQAVQSPESYFS